MHMRMEDMLAARRSDVPSDRESIGLKLVESSLGFRQHLTKVDPLV